MNTAQYNRDRLLQWLDEGLDEGADARSFGDAPAEWRESLQRALEDDPGLRAERRRTERLHDLLREDRRQERIEVDEGFTRRVMENLPVAPWERATSRAPWRLPLAAMLVFALGAALLFAGAGDNVFVGTGLALADFLQATALAGAGLLGATWRGVGLGLEQLFQGSPAALVAFAVLVIGIDLLFVALLRRRSTASESASSSDASEES